jgi:hypothetical protein
VRARERESEREQESVRESVREQESDRERARVYVRRERESECARETRARACENTMGANGSDEQDLQVMERKSTSHP